MKKPKLLKIGGTWFLLEWTWAPVGVGKCYVAAGAGETPALAWDDWKGRA